MLPNVSLTFVIYTSVIPRVLDQRQNIDPIWTPLAWRGDSALAKVAGKMSAAHVPPALYGSVVFCLLIATCAASELQSAHPTSQDGLGTKKIEIFEGLTVKIPQETNNTDKIFSFEIDTSNSVDQGKYIFY